MNKKYDFRILIIDDNIEIHNDFIKILTSLNSSSGIDEIKEKLFGVDKKNTEIILPQFQIDTATQGEQGAEKIAEAIKEGNPYSLAFVDIRMPPGWDGIETIKYIWKLDKDIQIVICSAYSDYSWEDTIAELGQSDNLLILKKPFDQIAVRQLACALTRKWKLMQDARFYTESLEHSVQMRTEELQHQATHDTLTDLPNRVLLRERINQAIANGERNHTIFAVLFFDLDRFKLINDSLSHSAGDELLRTVAKRLQTKIRASNILSRIGGDEFVLVIEDLKKPEQIINITISLLNTIKQSISIVNHEISISASIGISIYPKDGDKFDILIRNADTAMYQAKALGGNQFQFYTESMNEESIKRLELEADLRHAIVEKELFLCYQPQYDIKTSTLNAVEALVRWNHPEKGILLPLSFIPLAEEIGLVIPLGEWVLREACTQTKAWQNSGYPFIRVAVNITTQQLRQLNFIDMVKTILHETGLAPEYLELELSENSIINNPNVIKVINTLKEMGIKIAVDDFGTGYSSLNYLRNISLDRLKIDRSFVKNIQLNRGDEVIIKAIIAMASGLNLEVLAEGVETQKQLDFLKEEACGEIQGYYFSHPLLPNELEELLKNKANSPQLLIKED